MRKNRLFVSLCLFSAFVLWTAAVLTVDVQPIGTMGSSVGFSALNGSFHRFTGVHMDLYVLTDWLGLIPVFTGVGFALLGLSQWIRRRSILKVDADLMILGGFYIVMAAFYLFFESFTVNFRPVLIGGFQERSYPSSTTLLTLCVMPTAQMQFRLRIKKAPLRRAVSLTIGAFTLFMVLGRLISGVHWLTDIVGGLLLSAALVNAYRFFAHKKQPLP